MNHSSRQPMSPTAASITILSAENEALRRRVAQLEALITPATLPSSTTEFRHRYVPAEIEARARARREGRRAEVQQRCLPSAQDTHPLLECGDMGRVSGVGDHVVDQFAHGCPVTIITEIGGDDAGM